MSVTDVAKAAGEQWRNMTPAQKAPWDQKAATDKARYEKEKQEYNQ